MLAIGIPGDPIVAVLMGGLMIQGLTPGPMMFLANKDVIAGIFAAFLVGAVLLLPLGLALLPLFVRVLKIPQSILMAAVLLLSTLGTYALQRQVADLWIMWLFGLVGYLMRKGGFPLAPFVIGVVLGPIFESNLRRTTIMVGGDFWGFMLGRPIALCVLALALAALVLPMVQAWRSRRSNSAHTRSQAPSAEGL
jgi:putative tricarboxylic transport membrane protein